MRVPMRMYQDLGKSPYISFMASMSVDIFPLLSLAGWLGSFGFSWLCLRGFGVFFLLGVW